MGAAGEAVDDRVRGNAGPLKPPGAGEREGFGAAHDEGDQQLRIGGAGVTKPKSRRAVLGRQREQERLGGRILATVLGHQRGVDVEGPRDIGD